MRGGVLTRLADLATGRPRPVLAATAVFFLVAAVFGGPVFGLLKAGNDFEDPSAQARGQLERTARTQVDVGLVALGRLVSSLVIALGLGVAIDYSLFIVTRYREQLARHGPGATAMRRNLAIAGRTITFSALTVAAALASLLIFPQRFLYSMGLGGVVVTLIALATALVALPALLGAWPARGRAGAEALAAQKRTGGQRLLVPPRPGGHAAAAADRAGQRRRADPRFRSRSPGRAPTSSISRAV